MEKPACTIYAKARQEDGACAPSSQPDWAQEEFGFDHIAENIFSPIYPVIAADILDIAPQAGGIMIDIGCGGGHLGMALMERTEHKGYFVDINQAALKLAKARAQARGLLERSVFLLEDVHRMSFENNFADLIVSRGSYTFWADLAAALVEIHRILAPGGLAYIGGGMGNRQLRDSIQKKMQSVMPGWPSQVMQRSSRITNQWIHSTLETNGIAHEILDNEEQGRWILLYK